MLSYADWEERITLNSFSVNELKREHEWVIKFPIAKILYDDKYYGEVWTYLNESEWVWDRDFDVAVLKTKIMSQRKLIQMKRKIMESPSLKKMRIIDVTDPNAVFDLFYRDVVSQMADKHFFIRE